MRRVQTLYWIFALVLVFSAKTCKADQILLPKPIEGNQKVSQTETLNCAGVSSGELRQYPFGLDLLNQLRVSLLRTMLPFFPSMVSMLYDLTFLWFSCDRRTSGRSPPPQLMSM